MSRHHPVDRRDFHPSSTPPSPSFEQVWKTPAEIDDHWVTVTDAVALADPEVAVISAVPVATEVTKPVEDTVATPTSELDQVTVSLATG